MPLDKIDRSPPQLTKASRIGLARLQASVAIFFRAIADGNNVIELLPYEF